MKRLRITKGIYKVRRQLATIADSISPQDQQRFFDKLIFRRRAIIVGRVDSDEKISN